MKKADGCRVCALIRFYLLLAVPLLIMVGVSSSGGGESHGLPWFVRVDLINFLAYGAALSLVIILVFRGYVEYWLPRRRRRKLERVLQSAGND